MTLNLRETPAGAVRASWTARVRPVARSLAAAVVAGVFLALVGAFGTIQYSLIFRLAYWVALALTGTVIAFGVSHAVCKVVDGETRPWLAGGAVALILSFLMTGVIALLQVALSGAPVDAGLLPSLFVQVLVVSCAMTALVTAVQLWPRRERTGRAEAPDRVRFFDRFPPKLRGGALLAVEAQDHYLRIHTDRGNALILLRLSDAIEELAGIEGARTHRSWWVARDAIDQVVRTDGRTGLVLKGGPTAPVSRTYAPLLRRDGWL